MFALPLIVAACDVPRGAAPRNDLSKLRTVKIVIEGRTAYQALVAESYEQQQLGLMNIRDDELADDQGMLFDFDADRAQSFWMRNTIIPLDIAYIRSDGTIVKTYTMEPLDESGYPSIEPARFALEVKGGQFDRWGIREGDHVVIPSEFFD
jgi:hypothetical protein